MKLRKSQIETLEALALNGPMTSRDLASTLGVGTTAPHSRMEKLQFRGLVTAAGYPRQWSLTDKGRSALREAGKD